MQPLENMSILHFEFIKCLTNSFIKNNTVIIYNNFVSVNYTNVFTFNQIILIVCIIIRNKKILYFLTLYITALNLPNA